MANLTRWNPFQSFPRTAPFADVEDLFRGMSRRAGYPRDIENAMEMRMDVAERGDAYVVTVEIPGVRKENIDVAIEGNQVTLQAEMQREQTHDTAKSLYSERSSGQGYRSFSLPGELDAEKASAHYDGGVLTLTLPKKPNGESRRLPVR